MSRVGELSLAEHLQRARITLALGGGNPTCLVNGSLKIRRNVRVPG